MMSSFFSFVLAVLGFVLWWAVFYFVVRAAVRSAVEPIRDADRHANQLLGAQAELTARLAKHLIAQTDLMLAQARHQGMTEEDLEPVLKQIAERKADPTFSLPFS
jgi:hypothetical protein